MEPEETELAEVSKYHLRCLCLLGTPNSTLPFCKAGHNLPAPGAWEHCNADVQTCRPLCGEGMTVSNRPRLSAAAVDAPSITIMAFAGHIETKKKSEASPRFPPLTPAHSILQKGTEQMVFTLLLKTTGA